MCGLPIAMAVLLLASPGGATDSPPSGFTVSLVESGEVIVPDSDIESYDWEHHRLYLTAEGRERWEARVPRNPAFDPPIPMLEGSLNRKRFRVSLDGTELYEGTVWSIVSSLYPSGVTLTEPLGAPSGFLTIGFSQPPGEAIPDPRSDPRIRSHFLSEGRLRPPEER